MIGYAPALKEALKANYQGNVMNSRFAEFDRYVGECIKEPNSEKDSCYHRGYAGRLYERCMEHAGSLMRPVEADRVIALVHPLCLFLNERELLAGGKEKEAHQYLDRLMLLLNNKPEGFGVVLFEMAQHYAAATSLLAEQGLIDQVAFTIYLEGQPMDHSAISNLRHKEVFIGGAYNGLCLGKLIDKITKDVPAEKIYALTDIIVEAPWDKKNEGKLIWPENIRGVYGEYFDDPNKLTVANLIERRNDSPMILSDMVAALGQNHAEIPSRAAPKR